MADAISRDAATARHQVLKIKFLFFKSAATSRLLEYTAS